MDPDFLRLFENSLCRFDLEGKTLRVALSGGCDSIALMELLYRTFDRNRLAAVHVNHGIRDESGADSDFVRKFCEKRGVPLEIRTVDTPAKAESAGLGIEEAARELRYAIFREFTESGEVIATAHTADDCVETLLFNLARGSGPRGLGGIPRERDGIIRPLLDFFRKDIEKWLIAEGIDWREDESNLDLRFTRNRVRWMLLPEIRRVFGETALHRLRREAEVFSSCAEFISIQGAKVYEESIIARFGGVIALDMRRATVSRWGFGEVVRSALHDLGIGFSAIGFDTIERLFFEISNSRRGRRFPICEGAHIECDGHILFIFNELHTLTPVNIEVETAIELPFALGKFHISSHSEEGIRVPYGGGQLILRPPLHGDISQSNQKLLRSLSKRGVPRLIREIAPVLYENKTPLFSPVAGKLTQNSSLFEISVIYIGPLSANLVMKK
jgi:tRNA(Ile)-lysidine synthetase-like protein